MNKRIFSEYRQTAWKYAKKLSGNLSRNIGASAAYRYADWHQVQVVDPGAMAYAEQHCYDEINGWCIVPNAMPTVSAESETADIDLIIRDMFSGDLCRGKNKA